jgi:hypothetical protein
VTVPGVLSLAGWSAIGTLVLAIASVLALGGAVAQIATMRVTARRDRAYDYADRFNQPDIIALSAEYGEYWRRHSFRHFQRLSGDERAQLLVVPNLIEEAAAAYVRGLIDRDIAAQMLGVLVEYMWEISQPLVNGAQADRDEWTYGEWKAMQEDTKARRERSRRRTLRLRARLARKRRRAAPVSPPP